MTTARPRASATGGSRAASAWTACSSPTCASTIRASSCCAHLGLPAVTLGRPDGPSPLPAVCLDDRAGVRAAVEHLVELGHTARSATSAGARTSCTAAAGARPGRPPCGRPGWPPTSWPRPTSPRPAGAAATRELLRRDDPPTAIVYGNDVMAIAGLTVAHELGPHTSRATCRSSVSTTPSWPRTCTRRSLPCAPTPQAGAAPPRACSSITSTDAAPTSSCPPARLVVRASTAPTGAGNPDDRPYRPTHDCRPPWPRSPWGCPPAAASSGGSTEGPLLPRARSRSGTRTTRRRSPGARRGRGLEQGAPEGAGQGSGDPSRQELRGGDRCVDHRGQRSLPGAQHLTRRRPAVPEAGRPRRARRPSRRQGVRRVAQRRPGRSSTSRRTASTTSCPGSRTR